MPDRRTFLKAAAGGGLLAAAPLLFRGGAPAMAADGTFEKPLAIPPLDEGRLEKGVRTFELGVRSGSRRFIEELETPTLGIDADYLGPVLRVRRGERLRIAVHNGLDEDTTLHWHGLRLPGPMDGGPHQVIRPGSTWTPHFQVRQPAATCWFHSHQLHRTGEQVYRGIAGLFYIDDEWSDALALPADYGVDDFPLVLQDRSFNRDGSFRYADNMHTRMAGMLGNTLLVNGTLSPVLDVKHQRVRLRVLNGSNARIYNLAFRDGRSFHQVASDGGLLPAPVERHSLLLAPAERAEIVVELKPGEDLMLIHRPVELGGGGMMMRMTAGADDGPYPVLRLRATSDAAPPAKPLPSKLRPVERLAAGEARGVRRFRLDTRMMVGSTINGRFMDMARIDQKVRLGDVEVWEFDNRSPMPHPMHVHGVQFQILARNGRPPAAGETGWKDTVLVRSEEKVRVIARFEDAADGDNPFMFHCHNLEHEDGGMMGQFTVTA